MINNPLDIGIVADKKKNGKKNKKQKPKYINNIDRRARKLVINIFPNNEKAFLIACLSFFSPLASTKKIV